MRGRGLRSRQGQQARRRALYGFWGALTIALPIAVAAKRQDGVEYEEAPIQYSKTAPQDVITRLQEQIARGQVQLTYTPRHGYLEAVLKQLKIPASSQMLVFSKTSFQHDLISPETPRALYFNDNTYIGWVQNGRVLEVATVDPQLGAVFYTLPNTKSDSPHFTRQTYECLQCHDSGMAGSVPGFLMRSVYPDRSGYPILPAGTYVTSDQSPMQERWGGWYVTGTSGSQRHMGNMVAKSEVAPEQTDWGAGSNATDLKHWLDTAPYLSKHSDIVALMVSEHQTHLMNLITRANFETRRALHAEAALNKE